MYKKPPKDAVYEFLRSQRAFVVHFSGCPKGSGSDRSDNLFPKDLERVIRLQAAGGLSCSAIKVGDSFDFRDECRNSIGSVGVVLGFESEQSLVAASYTDLGSSEDEHGDRCQLDRDVNIDDLNRSFSMRCGYNEWVVRDYVPLGIFVAEPAMIMGIDTPDGYDTIPETVRMYVAGPTLLPCSIKAVEVENLFPGLPIFTFKDGDICKLQAGDWVAVDHTFIYT